MPFLQEVLDIQQRKLQTCDTGSEADSLIGAEEGIGAKDLRAWLGATESLA